MNNQHQQHLYDNDDDEEEEQRQQPLELLWRQCYAFVERELMPVLARENGEGDERPLLRPYAECNRYPDTQRIGIFVDHVAHVGQDAYAVMMRFMQQDGAADADAAADDATADNPGDQWSLDVHAESGEPYLEVVMRPVRRVAYTDDERRLARELAYTTRRDQYYARKERRACLAMVRASVFLVLTAMAIFWLVFLPYVARAPPQRKRASFEQETGIPPWMENWGVAVREHGWQWAGGAVISGLDRLRQSWLDSFVTETAPVTAPSQQQQQQQQQKRPVQQAS